MSPFNLSLFVRVLGFVTGIVLYAMLGVMAWQGRIQQRRTAREWASSAPTTSPFQASLLIVVAALGLILSIAANVLHMAAAVHTESHQPYRLIAWIIVVGYAVLMALIAVHMWRLTTAQRLFAILAILVFAASAAHLVSYSGGPESLSVELIAHNAPLPLVAALLYQEYRFGLADLFLKRALAFILLVIVASVLYVIAQRTDPRLTIAFWIATALGYPALRWIVYTSVDRFVLRRETIREVRSQLTARITAAQTPDLVLDHACNILRRALTAQWITWSEQDDQPTSQRRITPSVRITVPVADAPSYVIEVGPLESGRRLLFGDLDLLEAAALDIARRIDVIRLTTERYERSTREADALRLAAEAELRALHAQLNPHFLFNALTTIGYLIREAPDRAIETLLRLTDLLRAVLRRSGGATTSDLVTVRDEIALIEAYVAIERARFEERLAVHINVPSTLETVKIPPLIVQPLVENAIKHGITPRTEGGQVSISVTAADTNTPHDTLIVRVEDTGIGVTPTSLARGRARGVGLNNIARRLEQYYAGAASLTVQSTPGTGTIVEVRFPRHAA